MNLSDFFSSPDQKSTHPRLERVEFEPEIEIETTEEEKRYTELGNKLIKKGNLTDEEWKEKELLEEILGIQKN